MIYSNWTSYTQYINYTDNLTLTSWKLVELTCQVELKVTYRGPLSCV